ncbi:MAG: NAD(P)-dependent alcohol dehydrogenase [bacterium]|nr:NAD(P)-dependent alcohol dehydrogenase [bacterium]
MKAIVATKYGPPEVLQIKEIEKPTPGNNEILVKVFATTVSAADYRVRSFNVPISFWLPARFALGLTKPRNSVLGMDFSGVVEAVGKNVTKYKVGDPVFGLMGHQFGCYAQYLCLSEDWKLVGIAGKPANLNFEEAAAIPFGGLTALYFMREAKIQKGQKVLITGASGSVGTSAVQIAKYYCAEVTAVCRTDKIELVKSLGADKIVDYTKDDFTKSGELYDVIFEVAGKTPFSDCIKSLTKTGTLLHAVAVPAVTIQMKWQSITTGRKMIGGGPDNNSKDLIFLKELVESGKLKPIIDRSYPMEQIVEAHKYVGSGHKKGNVVVTIEHND